MERWKEDFIIGLQQGKPVDVCARILAGMPLTAVYEAREDDPDFATRWDNVSPTEDVAISDKASTRTLTPASLEAIMWSQCDDEEAAAYFSMELGEFRAAIAEDKSLTKAYKLGPLGGKAALKRVQFEGAMAGDRQMQTWVGKQILGQSDKVDIKDTTKKDVDEEALAKQLLFIMQQGGVELPAIDAEIVPEDPVAITDMRDDGCDGT